MRSHPPALGGAGERRGDMEGGRAHTFGRAANWERDPPPASPLNSLKGKINKTVRQTEQSAEEP